MIQWIRWVSRPIWWRLEKQKSMTEFEISNFRKKNSLIEFFNWKCRFGIVWITICDLEPLNWSPLIEFDRTDCCMVTERTVKWVTDSPFVIHQRIKDVRNEEERRLSRLIECEKRFCIGHMLFKYTKCHLSNGVQRYESPCRANSANLNNPTRRWMAWVIKVTTQSHSDGTLSDQWRPVCLIVKGN